MLVYHTTLIRQVDLCFHAIYPLGVKNPVWLDFVGPMDFRNYVVKSGLDQIPKVALMVLSLTSRFI